MKTGIPKTDFKALNESLYEKYDVHIRLRDRIYGGIPQNKKMVEAWVAARTGYNDEQTKKQVGEVELPAQLDEKVAEQIELSKNGFEVDERGLFIRTRNVKAMLREAAHVLRLTDKKRGSKQILQYAHAVKGFVPPEWNEVSDQKIWLEREKADATEERPIHVQTPQGPRTSIKVVDYCDKPEARFQLWFMATEAAEKRHLTDDDIEKVLALCTEIGLGADRSQVHGKFDVVSFEKLDPEA